MCHDSGEWFESDVPENSARGIEVVDCAVDDIEEVTEERSGDSVRARVEEPVAIQNQCFESNGSGYSMAAKIDRLDIGRKQLIGERKKADALTILESVVQPPKCLDW